MGDAWIGIQHARRPGHMLTGQEGSYTSPERWCERCGARLRQRNHGTQCAPCDEATRVVAQTHTASPYVCPQCGGPKKHESNRCRTCANRHTPICRCGKPTRRGRTRCRTCERADLRNKHTFEGAHTFDTNTGRIPK